MKRKYLNKYIKNCIALIVAAIAVSCSTTKRIEDGEVLYTGVKKINIVAPNDSLKLPSELISNVKSSLNVAPNNPLISPYIRSPFPIGLWVYNNWNVDEYSSKFKKWMYNMLVREPVLISTVRPEMRMKVLENTLADNGYFGSIATYQIIPDKKNPKKARISYTINVREPHRLSKIELLNDTLTISRMIDSLAVASEYLQRGNIYNVDSLNALRTNITNKLRNRGYYYFRPDYIEYLADSISVRDSIILRMVYTDGIPKAALKKYYTGDITVNVFREGLGGVPDTFKTNRCTVVQWKPSHLRESLIPSCLTFRKGRVFSVRSMNLSQQYLSRVGIFQAINMAVTPMDSLKEGQNTLDVNVTCMFDKPIEATAEVAANYKSNSFIGPEISAGIAHNNLFGGGERLSFKANGAYEWQIGKAGGSSRGDNNYYEFGIGATLSFPRLLAPKFLARSRRDVNWTDISVNANLYNNPSSLKFFQASISYTYKWRTNRHITNELDLPKLTYSKRLRASKGERLDFSSAESVWEYYTRRSAFIPTIGYTINYETTFGAHHENSINWRNSITESGNILAGIWHLAGSKGGVDSKKLFGVPFSQFVRLQTQLVYSRMVAPKNYIVGRALVGAGFIYGNSDYMPYGEDFYAGGPNTIRAFGIKSLGPGSFHDMDGYNSQFLHSGSFQLIMNVEYRFPLVSFLHGAVFVDAGNVWLLKDPNNIYPGGVLRKDTFLKDIALGTGFGLRLDFSMIVVRADLGIGIHAPYDTGKKSYYNMPSFKNSLALNIAIGYPF